MILRNTIVINSSFSASDVTDEHNIYLGLFTKLLFSRLIAIYSSWKVYSMFPLTYISCDYCCVSFVSQFINLRHSRDITSHTSRMGTLYIRMTCIVLQELLQLLLLIHVCRGWAIFDSSSAHSFAHGELKEQHEVAPVALMHVFPRVRWAVFIWFSA